MWGYPAGVSGYGTYNQSGNVWEWCRDWYGDDYYGKSPAKNPGGPEGGSDRVFRGGCWINFASDSRVALRFGDTPDNWNFNLGFRLVRTAS